MCLPAPATIATALRSPAGAVEAIWPLIVAALQEFGINTDMVQVAAAATISVECPSWVPCAEKHANPDRQPDLWRLQQRYWPSGFYGRGLVQTTWHDNYAALGKALGLDLVNHPDLLLQPAIAARALAHYFATHGVARCADLKDWRGCRLRVNGGYTALDKFMVNVDALLGVLNGS